MLFTDCLLAVDVEDIEPRLVSGVDPTASTTHEPATHEPDVTEGVLRSCDPLDSTANELKACTGAMPLTGKTLW